MKACAIPECPALSLDGLETCKQHETARLACKLPLCVGSHCDDCKRVIGKDDWMQAEPRKWRNRQKQWKLAYRHVRCEPAAPRVTREQIRESPKPLFGDIDDDAQGNRGAA